MRNITIEFEVPWSEQGVRVACGMLTALNRTYLRNAKSLGKRIPRLYDAGVRYRKQPRGRERFLGIPQVLARRSGDCDQLACWRAAELQEQGIDARAVPISQSDNLFHIIVKWPDGRLEDPSRRLGMGANRG